MREKEAHLRIKEAIGRALKVQTLLTDVKNLIKAANQTHKNKCKKTFVVPIEEDIKYSRWKNYCTSATRQLYGLNQKVRVLNRHMCNEQWNLTTLRLLSQATLNTQTLLKGLLMFPHEIASTNRDRHKTDNMRDDGPVSCVVKVATELMQLMQLVGMIPGSTSEELKEDCVNNKNGTTTNNNNSTSNESLVDSDVVATLDQQQRASHHLAHLASQHRTLHKLQSVQLPGPTMPLPHGRLFHLLHDSLSHRLVTAANNEKAEHRQSKKDHKISSTKLNKIRPNKVAVKVGISKRLPQSKRTLIPRYKKNARLLKQSTETEDTDSDCSQGSSHSEKDPGGDCDYGTDSINGRKQLWEQLMPLLAHQDITLGDNTKEWKDCLGRVDRLINRVQVLQTGVQARQRLISRQRLQFDPAPECSEPCAAVSAARKLLASIGFLTLTDRDECTWQRGVDASHEDCSDATPGVRNMESDTDKDTEESLQLFNDIRARREEFWIGLTKDGFIDSS